MVERRVLGKEELTLIDGSVKLVNVYAVGYAEKWRIIQRNTNVVREKGYTYKEVDEPNVRNEVLKIALSDVDYELLDYNTETLYEKYFTPNKETEKKEKTSTDGQMDIESQETVQQ